tara:strand:+ start:1703 stop:3529 length:1827 start_codon:yes stop_codon:yes gene_type:complete
MDPRSTAFALALVKEAKEKKRSYPGAMLALAPAAAASAAADFPRGWVDEAVKRRIAGTPPGAPKSWKRGAGRATGRLGAALVTTPMFFDGIKDLKESKTKEQRNRGLAKIIGSGAVFSATKGGIEESIAGGLKKGFKKALDVGKVRGLIGAGAAAATAASVAKSMKGSDKQSKSAKNRFIIPAAAGAGIGALKGGAEYAWVERSGLLKKLKTPKKILGSAAGRAASGALGALALSEIARAAMKKTASESDKNSGRWSAVNFGPKTGDIYDQVSGWSKATPSMDIRSEMDKMIDPEKTPTRRAAYYAMHDTLSGRGEETPPLLVRDKVHPRTKAPNIVDSAAIAAVVASPYVAWEAIKKISPTMEDTVLQDALDRMLKSKDIFRWETPNRDAFGNYQHYAGFQKTTLTGKTPAGTPFTVKKDMPFVALGPKRTPGSPGVTPPWTIAHEMGHATADPMGIRRKTIGSNFAKKLHQYAAIPTIVLPLLAMESAGDKSFATSEELEDKAKLVEAMGAVSAAAMAPKLMEEGLASMKGFKYLAEAGMRTQTRGPILDAVKRSLKRGVPAFATYAAPLLAPLLASKVLRSKSKKVKREENVRMRNQIDAMYRRA